MAAGIHLALGKHKEIKDLKVALQCLSKIGAELLVEGTDSQVRGGTCMSAGWRHMLPAVAWRMHASCLF
jgi:hypothetical protein